MADIVNSVALTAELLITSLLMIWELRPEEGFEDVSEISSLHGFSS